MKNKFIIGVSVALFLIFLFFWIFKFSNHYPNNININNHKEDYFGVTFSTKFAKELGLNWKEAYDATVEDLSVKNIRIPMYWDEIEKKEGEYDYSSYDYMLSKGEKNNVNFILSLGYRIPRWPECHFPGWVEVGNKEKREKQTLEYIKKTVNRYKGYNNIKYWQVENEPFLNTFGHCPKLDPEFLKEEIDLVKKLDNQSRPLIVSASGELGTWDREIKLSDYFGTTVYRVVWNPILGYINYPFPSWFYRKKLDIFGTTPDRAIITELQAEPWVPEGNMLDLKEEELQKSFSLKQFKANIQYAINIDLEKSYLWGVEWWYARKLQGDSTYWNTAKQIFK